MNTVKLQRWKPAWLIQEDRIFMPFINHQMVQSLKDTNRRDKKVSTCLL